MNQSVPNLTSLSFASSIPKSSVGMRGGSRGCGVETDRQKPAGGQPDLHGKAGRKGGRELGRNGHGPGDVAPLRNSEENEKLEENVE